MSSGEQKISKVEEFKIASQGLAGTIKETIEGSASHFEEADLQLLKFHGSYQQDDRDLRSEMRKQGLDKAWMFMARAKIPGGRVSPDQYLALDQLCDACGNGTMRITSRQGLQFHGVHKENFKNLIKSVNDTRLTTLGGCGDVNRNAMCCPVSDLDERANLGLEKLCQALADHFTPRTTTYWEIWCDGEKWGQPVDHNIEEPIYGPTYLPRKFKMAVAVPEDNCIDLYTHDVGVETVHDGGTLLAWDLIIGGGMGFTHGQTQTFPRLGDRFVRIQPSEAVAVIEEIVKIQRDFGGRADRKHARLKYLLEDRGLEWFRAELFRRLGRELPPAGPMPQYHMHDHLGWHTAPDGSLFLGLHLLSGRIADTDAARTRSGIRELVRRFNVQVRLTPKQDLVLVGFKPSDQATIEQIIADYGLRTDRNLPTLRRLATACVALPTCGLALAESERYIPTLLGELEKLGVADAPVEIRMTGCPNSCVRSPMAEIGIIGRGPSRYAVYLGGSQGGTRLAFLFNEKIDEAELPGFLAALINLWRTETGQGVAFGDWAFNQGADTITRQLGGGRAPQP
jgi:sulfite reductase beta subunit-like hemoprotein